MIFCNQNKYIILCNMYSQQKIYIYIYISNSGLSQIKIKSMLLKKQLLVRCLGLYGCPIPHQTLPCLHRWMNLSQAAKMRKSEHPCHSRSAASAGCERGLHGRDFDDLWNNLKIKRKSQLCHSYEISFLKCGFLLLRARHQQDIYPSTFK